MGSALEVRTEDIFKDRLVKAGYNIEGGVRVDRQACTDPVIDDLFSHASKTEGSDRKGYPDFIVTGIDNNSTVMVVECKASLSDMKLAINQAIHYASYVVQSGRNCIVIGACGTTEQEFKTACAIVRKDGSVIKESTVKQFEENVIYTWDKYQWFIEGHYDDEKKMIASMAEVADVINHILYEAGDLPTWRRMLTVSACILALRDRVFRNSFTEYSANDVLEGVLTATERTLRNYGIPHEKVTLMMGNFGQLRQSDTLNNGVYTEAGYSNPLTQILSHLHQSKLHDVFEGNASSSFDVMGKFYNEFITHGRGGADAKTGFVLTPQHICELFADLAGVDEKSKIVDMCFGTGGFLVAALKKALDSCKDDADKMEYVRNNNIYGIELDGDRYTYGCVNMILRGDGKSHMIQGDCFRKESVDYIKSGHCNVGFMNPPYALGKSGGHTELEFIENLLDCLEPNGTGIVIVPSSCATMKSGVYEEVKSRILQKHTLEAVLSMPDQLFYPAASAVTCVMIFTAHKPHNSERKTWFAKCKDDGFVIDRVSKGRADINERWQEIKKKWVNAYIDRDVIDGFSVKHSVTAKDEWSAEAWMKTDYSGITEDSFKKVVKEFCLFQLSQVEV